MGAISDAAKAFGKEYIQDGVTVSDVVNNIKLITEEAETQKEKGEEKLSDKYAKAIAWASLAGTVASARAAANPLNKGWALASQ